MPNESLNLNLLSARAPSFLLHLASSYSSFSAPESQEGNAPHSTVPATITIREVEEMSKIFNPHTHTYTELASQHPLLNEPSS